MNISYTAIMILAVLNVSACKQKAPTSAEVKSLDNFAKGDGEDITVNRCGITYNGSLSSLPESVRQYSERVNTRSQALKDETLATLTSVPQTLLDIFYNLGGSIEVSNSAVSQCQNGSLADSEVDFIGNSGAVQVCWKQVESGEPPVILIAENAELIRHSLVRLFGYMFTDFIVARLASDQAPEKFKDPEWTEAIAAFVDMRRSLAQAFLSDLKVVDQPAFTRLSSFNDADAVKFENYVFAEALDSYYCSDETRKTFKKDYKKAFALFTDRSNPEAPAVQFGELQ